MKRKKRNIALIHPPLPYKADPLTPLGLESLQGSLVANGYPNTQIIDAAIGNKADVQSIIDAIRAQFPQIDFIGISVLPSVAEFTKELIGILREEFKEKALEICVGGYFPSAFEERSFDYFDPNVPDYVVLGRGEKALLDILEYGKSQPIPNVLSYVDDRILSGSREPVDLMKTSWPLRSRQFVYGFDETTAKVTRLLGCPGRCTFCTVHQYAYDNQKEKIKQRTPKDFVEEMDYLHHEFGVAGFDILDDDALGDNPNQWYEILDEMERRDLAGKVKFWILTRIEGVANNPELIKRMAESGMTGAYLGLESLLERQLKLYNKMNSRLTRVSFDTFIKQVEDAKQILEDNGVILKFGFIPIDAEVTLEELEENIKRLNDMGLLYYVSELTKRVAVYEGSGIQKIYRKKGYLHPIEYKCDADWIIQRYNYDCQDPRIRRLQPFLDTWMKSTYQTSIYVKSLNRERYSNPDSAKSDALWQLYKDLRNIEHEMVQTLIKMIKEEAPGKRIMEQLAGFIEKYNSIFTMINGAGNGN